MTEFTTNAELRIEAERLADENERLKALARDMFNMLRSEDIDGYMRMVGGKPEFHRYADRMREAGIEVGE